MNIKELVSTLNTLTKEYFAKYNPLLATFDTVYESDLAQHESLDDKWELYKSVPIYLLRSGWYDNPRDYTVKSTVTYEDTLEQKIVETFEFVLCDVVLADDSDDEDSFITKGQIVEYIDNEASQGFAEVYSSKLRKNIYVRIPSEVITKWKESLIKNKCGRIHIPLY